MITEFLSAMRGSMAKNMIASLPFWIVLQTFLITIIPHQKKSLWRFLPPMPLRQKSIKNAQVVLVIGGMYTLYHEWMAYEVNEAMRMGKPIIAIMPWGGVYMPLELQSKATRQVGWNSASIVKAIRELA